MESTLVKLSFKRTLCFRIQYSVASFGSLFVKEKDPLEVRASQDFLSNSPKACINFRHFRSTFGFRLKFNYFEKRERSVRYSFLTGSLSQRTCPGQMTTLWWPASSHMDITSHYAFFASTRNSWMELFPANFCQCIVQINF